eukprot:gene10875-35266_t
MLLQSEHPLHEETSIDAAHAQHEAAAAAAAAGTEADGARQRQAEPVEPDYQEPVALDSNAAADAASYAGLDRLDAARNIHVSSDADAGADAAAKLLHGSGGDLDSHLA